jgi:steroid delta-isomerase-like uncharacterized protein
MSDTSSLSANRVAAPVEVVTRFLDDVINGGAFELIDELWAADMAWHGGSLGEYHGREQWKAINTHAATAFTDMHLTVHDIVTEAEKVAVRFTNSGRHTGQFMGVPATGKQVEWLGIGIYTVRAGKIVDAWFGEDMLGLLLALGAITLPTATA